MKFSILIILVCLLCFSAFLVFKLNHSENDQESEKYDGPAEFILFHQGIRTREGETQSSYQAGYQIREFSKAKIQAQASNARTQSNGVLEWKERGPANVPGRTRGLAVFPTDPNKNTWLAGSSGGGIWKTTNGGTTWVNKSKDFPSLAVATLAICTNTPTVVYAGTGEYIASSGTAIRGNGIFKSVDSGETWSHLASTINNDFISITRVIVDPNNPNIVLACSAPNTWGPFSSTIMRSTDGGISWTKVYEVLQSGAIEQIIATPGNFNIQYAAQNGVGVLKSVDAGLTWSFANVGMSISRRLEIAVSPVEPSRLFVSSEGDLSGSGSDLYVSDDSGLTWSLVGVSINSIAVDFLGGQGWYDNTIACDPFDEDVVYFGGQGLFRLSLGSGSAPTNSFTAQEDGTSFMTLIDFGGTIYGGRIRTGTSADISVEVRFGPGKSQQAHRFLVPETQTIGVPDLDYSYQDYVEVPFEVWHLDENGNDVEQLMVSFRDQDRNGVFNLLHSNTTGSAIEQSREYIFISNQSYNSIANPNIAINGGHTFGQMYFFWPTLSAGSTWTPDNLPASEFRILYGSIGAQNATTITVADVYSDFDGKNNFATFGVDLHPDQHNMIMIPMSGSTYKIVASNDGGVFVSNTSATPGINEGDWTMVGRTYNTSQFYGVDKRPGFDEYFGGMQDNGTWKSPSNEIASSATNYLFNIGGDGFEVLWHSVDDNKLIGGSQGNKFMRSVNSGANWGNATVGLSGQHPFISKLANSKNNPEVIYTVSSNGVFRSNNFGSSWTLTSISEKWGGSTFLDVEVSRANPNTIWAGSGMTSSRNIHVSTDAGQSFSVTNNFTDVLLGSISKLSTHPHDENIAYALFSFSDGPKVLRTTDLGQSWQDISGFGTGNESVNGFPDVAVYCLYVRPDNPDIIWVGTEIGIVESQDNGQTWALIDDFPSVSVWDMKGQDNQVVIATHGRGIWTATIEAPQITMKTPEVIGSGTSPKQELLLKIKIEEEFDSVQFFENATLLESIDNATPSELILKIKNLSPGSKKIRTISYKGNAPYHSPVYTVPLLNILSIENSYSTYFNLAPDLTLSGFSLKTTPGASSSERKSMQTAHNYPNNADQTIILRHPIKVSDSFPALLYSDIAIVEPGDGASVFGTPEFKDFVVMEASKNGLDWTPLGNGYNASANPTWLNAYNASQPGTKDMFVTHEINLDDTFNAGDTLLIRYRLSANQTGSSWGAALSYIVIQQAPTGVENQSLSGSKLNLFPNPSSGNFTIQYELSRPTEVHIEVIDVFGGKILSKALGAKDSGIHTEPFHFPNVSSGNYFVIVKTNDGNKIGKISLSK